MLSLVLAVAAIGADPSPCGSFLARPSYCMDHALRGPSSAYSPEPGDIMMAADGSKFWLVMHNIAGTSHPTHSAIVFRRSNGEIAILEGGPHDTLRCRALDAIPHLRSYECEGRVWIRKRCAPLTAEQNAALTCFAEQTDGKRFAIGRLGLQLTPFRTRGPLKTFFAGKPYYNRNSYFCSELVMESLVVAGLVDPCTTRPSATYPRDIFMDRSLNVYLNRHLHLAPDWAPPARWTSQPIPSCYCNPP